MYTINECVSYSAIGIRKIVDISTQRLGGGWKRECAAP
jgi:hypothetical protein